MWKATPEISARLAVLESLPELDTLYSISNFWLNAVYPEDYRASSEWTELLKLSEYGDRVLGDLENVLEDIPRADVMLACFGKFFHHELFFDHRISDAKGIRELLEKELLQDTIRLPYRYGRLLYDRFNDTYLDTRTDHLPAREIQKLLAGLPVGVYQIGRVLSGPLGVLDSDEVRFAPPPLSLPLWHCSDTGCNAVHHVKLLPPSVPIVEAFARIDKALVDREGPPSEWASVLTWLHRGPNPCPTRAYVDLPMFLGDCILGEERTLLVERALGDGRRDLLRSLCSRPPRHKADGTGSPSELAHRLPPEAQLQLLLVLTDQNLINLVDEAVYERRIKVPLGEHRRCHYLPPHRGGDTGSELSSLGLRSIRNDQIVNLTSALWRAYQACGLINELEWRVRSDAGQTAYDGMVSFIRRRGPGDAVRELLLSSAQVTQRVCDELGIPLKHVSGNDSNVVDRMLWKLGFNPMRYDELIPRFKARLHEFNEVLLSTTPVDTEAARERIRASGVNVFVSVEEFLDRLIAYNIWVLSSDHFVGTKFRYSQKAARACVSHVLGQSASGGEGLLLWNDEGENALGVLLRYLRTAANWMMGLRNIERQDLVRSERDLPHFATDRDVVFPFRHVALWADADPTELHRYGDTFAKIAKLVEESDLATVRNGLDHFREIERFPDVDRMLACVARLGQALELADLHRYLPKVFWLLRRNGNRFGQVEYEFKDYAGRSAFAYGPALASGMPQVRYEHACLIAPGNLMALPQPSLIFQLREESMHSVYWKEFPRRRRIPTSPPESTPHDNS